MHLNFKIESNDLPQFIDRWSKRYRFVDEGRYERNVGKPLTEVSRLALFSWKNGTGERIAALKLKSIEANYPLQPPENLEDRYLRHSEPGGAIWNIFYLHCINPAVWPIFDQHTYRAMRFMQGGVIKELGVDRKVIYGKYAEYREFVSGLKIRDSRATDKALFAFGQFLKLAKPYL